MMLLSQQAVNDHLDASPELRFKLEMQRIRMLAQAELDKMRSQIQVSPDEVAQYYTDHPSEFDVVQIREFLIRKRHSETEDPESGLKAEDAKAKAESIRKALASGDSPEKVAEDLAGPGVVLIDPKPRTFRRNEMVPALEKATFEAKDGTVPEAVDTPDAFLVVDVLRRGHLEQKEAATEIDKKIRQHKVDAQIDDMKKKAGVWMDDDYFKDDAVAAPRALTAQPQTSDPNAAPNRE
jgi:PPIC-type PPIASE domain